MVVGAIRFFGLVYVKNLICLTDFDGFESVFNNVLHNWIKLEKMQFRLTFWSQDIQYYGEIN